MATFIFDLLSYDRRAALVRHSSHFLRPLQEPLVSNVPTSLPIASLNLAPPDRPFPFHLFLLMNINLSSKGYLTRPRISTAAWTPPPTQLQFYYSTQAKFVICDCTIETSYRCMRQVRAWTTSRNGALRFLLLSLAFILVNLWVELRWHFCQTKRRGRRQIDPKRFELQRMVSFLNQAIEKIYGLVSFIVADVPPLGI